MAKATKADLVKEAEGLGIDVDGRWGIETIQEKIDAVKAEKGQDGQGDAEDDSKGATEADAEVPASADPSASDRDRTADATFHDAGAADAESSNSSAGPDDVSGVRDTQEPARSEPPEDVAAGGTAGEPSQDADEHGSAVLNVTADQLAALKSMTWPILAAYQAACSVYGVNRRWIGEGVPLDADWILPGRDQSAKVIAIMRDAVPFVRTWPDAPAEALYGHVSSDGGVNLVLDRAWSDLGLVDQAAWTVFRDTLVTLDRFLASDAARNAAVEERPVYAVSADELTLETADERFAPSF
ncbi:hypothetical protein [Aureimonas sp. D3]|uniref:hypothetical protein n=1 Tax=Aureimonas sp. D3 TaxID=1638164 RepID=UPI0007825A12|nr:hypothetical protein [Aureimonas sp. D3]